MHHATNRPCLSVLCWMLFSYVMNAWDEPTWKKSTPMSPEESCQAIKVLDGLEIKLVAHEPQVIDPVCVTFTANGDCYVMEMRDYPLGPPRQGDPPLGRVKRLIDQDGDGVYESSQVFAEGLLFATGLAPYRQGLLVMSAPDLLYFEDADKDGKAEIRKVIATGFAMGNPQHRPNLMNWGPDQWLHVSSSHSRGLITFPSQPGREFQLRGTDFRVKLETQTIENTPGATQYGMSFDDWGNCFTQTNSDHIRQVVIGKMHHWLTNPNPTVHSPMTNISDHGQSCRLFPVSKPQTRFNDFGSLGHATSACASLAFRGSGLPTAFRNQVFTCEPVHNLVHVDRIVESSPQFVAQRMHADQEVIASSDQWFRPCFLANDPSGGLLICDMYREHVEHPEWIPQSVLKEINVRAGDDRGRLYRLTSKGAKSMKPANLAALSDAELVARLNDLDSWVVETANRLLVERNAKGVSAELIALVKSSDQPTGRLRAFRLLDHFDQLSPTLLADALADSHPAVRREAIWVLEKRRAFAPVLVTRTLNHLDDPDPSVRLQLALALGAARKDGERFEYVESLALSTISAMANKHGTDLWIRFALVNSAYKREWECCPADNHLEEAGKPFVRDLFRSYGARATTADIDKLFARLLADRANRQQIAPLLFEGLAQGHEQRRQTRWQGDVARYELARILASPNDPWRDAARELATCFDWSQLPTDDAMWNRLLAELKGPAMSPEQLAQNIAIGLGGKSSVSERFLNASLLPNMPSTVQRSAVSAAIATSPMNAWQMLQRRWKELLPPVRFAALDAALRRQPLRRLVLEQVQAKNIMTSEFSPDQRMSLLTDSDDSINRLAKQCFTGVGHEERAKVVQQYLDVAKMKGENRRGWQLFREHCGRCHRIENAGGGVGPSLETARGYSKERLIESILNPSHSVEPAFLGYIVNTTDGQVLNGLIERDDANGITVMFGDGKRQTIPRNEIESMKSTGKSVMPEGLERTLDRQGLADLIAFLRNEKN